jgi:hypothetical protein
VGAGRSDGGDGAVAPGADAVSGLLDGGLVDRAVLGEQFAVSVLEQLEVRAVGEGDRLVADVPPRVVKGLVLAARDLFYENP